MFVCEFICAILGVTDGTNQTVVKAQIALICIYIFFFASTWGPGAWVVIGEIFPIPIRSRGVGLSTASNWLWNCILTVITPYLVGTDQAVRLSSLYTFMTLLIFRTSAQRFSSFGDLPVFSAWFTPTSSFGRPRV
jgi:hypothetical protein